MKPWRLVHTGQAAKDAKKLAASGLRPKARYLLDLLAEDPFRTPPRFEKLVGDPHDAAQSAPPSRIQAGMSRRPWSTRQTST